MKKCKYKFDYSEIQFMIGALVEWRNQLLADGKNSILF